MREMLFERVAGRREAMAQEGLFGTPWKGCELLVDMGGGGGGGGRGGVCTPNPVIRTRVRVEVIGAMAAIVKKRWFSVAGSEYASIRLLYRWYTQRGGIDVGYVDVASG